MEAVSELSGRERGMVCRGLAWKKGMTRLLPILLLSSGCAADFTDPAYLSRPAPGPVAQARRDALAKALADDRAKHVKHEAIMAHAHKHATNGVALPVGIGKVRQ